MKNYQQLTLEQRYQISARLKTGMKKSAIASQLSADFYFSHPYAA